MSDADLCGLLWITSTEALRKAFADSKSFGRNKGVLPLTVDFSVHEPSIRELEQYLTALARSRQPWKETGSETLDQPGSVEGSLSSAVISAGELGVPVETGESAVGNSRLAAI